MKLEAPKLLNMKNYFKILTFLIAFSAIVFSCNEKNGIQDSEFEFENVLMENGILFQNVENIVSDYNKDAYNLRLSIVKDDYDGDINLLKDRVKNLSKEEKSLIWKDRIIESFKEKEFNKMQYEFLLEVYKDINPKIFDEGSSESVDFKKKWLSRFETKFKTAYINHKKAEIKNVEGQRVYDLVLTLTQLSENYKIACGGSGSPKVDDRNCTCNWGTFCPLDCNSEATCNVTSDGCGFLWFESCDGLCDVQSDHQQ